MDYLNGLLMVSYWKHTIFKKTKGTAVTVPLVKMGRSWWITQDSTF
jgi:hypothetical protein